MLWGWRKFPRELWHEALLSETQASLQFPCPALPFVAALGVQPAPQRFCPQGRWGVEQSSLTQEEANLTSDALVCFGHLVPKVSVSLDFSALAGLSDW